MQVVVPIREGRLPLGCTETVSEYQDMLGHVKTLLVGTQTAVAAEQLKGVANSVTTVELDTFQPGAWSQILAPMITADHVILPGCPDGRDLAPRLAAVLGRKYFGSCVEIKRRGANTEIQMVRWGGLVMETLQVVDKWVACVIPGMHTAISTDVTTTIQNADNFSRSVTAADVMFVQEIEPDAATMDLVESKRIVGGGAGLADASVFALLGRVATALDSSVGATRVVTDRGWVEHERQIGTTGIVVDPDLYMAFAVSGAVQHTSGLGEPKHIISVNTDPHCPMMQLADLAIVSDANDVIVKLAELLNVSVEEGAP